MLAGEQESKFTWVGEHDHLSMTKFSKIFHAMSWNIFGIFVFHMENFM
jgi:hypothetical protein